MTILPMVEPDPGPDGFVLQADEPDDAVGGSGLAPPPVRIDVERLGWVAPLVPGLCSLTLLV